MDIIPMQRFRVQILEHASSLWWAEPASTNCPNTNTTSFKKKLNHSNRTRYNCGYPYIQITLKSTIPSVSVEQSPHQQSFPIQIQIVLNTKLIQMKRNTNNICQIWKTSEKVRLPPVSLEQSPHQQSFQIQIQHLN